MTSTQTICIQVTITHQFLLSTALVQLDDRLPRKRKEKNILTHLHIRLHGLLLKYKLLFNPGFKGEKNNQVSY